MPDLQGLFNKVYDKGANALRVTDVSEVRHLFARDGWNGWVQQPVTQDGDQVFELSVEGGYGRVTGTESAQSNKRDFLLHPRMEAENGEITAVFKGPSTYVSSPSVNRPQQGLVLRYQEVEPGVHSAYVVWYDVFAGNPAIQNVNVWRGDGETTTLAQAAGGQFSAEIARDLRVLGVRRISFLGGINEYCCQPYHLHGLTASDTVTIDVNTSVASVEGEPPELTLTDDATYDETSVNPSNPDRLRGTFQVADSTETAAEAYKAADGIVTLDNPAKRFFPYVLKARLVGDTVFVKAWRGRYDPEPDDWQAVVTVATDDDVPALPEGPGLWGVMAGHAHDGSYMEFGDISFKRL